MTYFVICRDSCYLRRRDADIAIGVFYYVLSTLEVLSLTSLPVLSYVRCFEEFLISSSELNSRNK